MRGGLLPLTLPAWYRAFAPIQVPWEDVKPDDLPDILDLVRANAARAPDLGWGKGSGDGQGDGDGSGTGPGTGAGTGGGSGTGSGTGSGAGTGTIPGGIDTSPVPRVTVGGRTFDWPFPFSFPLPGTDGNRPENPGSNPEYPVRPGSPPPPYDINNRFGVTATGPNGTFTDEEYEEFVRRANEWGRWYSEYGTGELPLGVGVGVPTEGSGTSSSDSSSGGGGGGSTGEQPTEYAQFPGLGGIDIPPYPLPPGPSDFEPDYAATLGGVFALPDLISGGGGGGSTGETPPTPTDIWAGGGAFPDVAPFPLPPGPDDFEPDTDAMLGGAFTLLDLIFGAGFGGFGGAIGQEIPRIMPGDLPLPDGGASSALGGLNSIASLLALADVKDNPQGAMVGGANLLGAGPLAPMFGGALATINLIDAKGGRARQSERSALNVAGQNYVDQVLSRFWTDYLKRDPDWMWPGSPAGFMGTGSADQQFVNDWVRWLGETGIGGRPETPFQNFGRLGTAAGPAIAQALQDYYTLLGDAAPRVGPGAGEYAVQNWLTRKYGEDVYSPWDPYAGVEFGFPVEPLPDASTPAGAARLALLNGTMGSYDPEFDAWLRDFQRQRPDVVRSLDWLSNYSFGP